jgi:hypothetical protein
LEARARKIFFASCENENVRKKCVSYAECIDAAALIDALDASNFNIEIKEFYFEKYILEN